MILVLLLVVGTCIYCIERIGTTGLAAWNAGDELRSTLQRYEWEGVKWTDGKEAIAQLSATYSSLRWKTAAYVVMMAVVCLVSAYMFHGLKY